jgi:glycosyltransferase involved in cell wall biosynthesis
MKNLPQISIISPVYKAENVIIELVTEIQRAMANMDCAYEIVLVDDGSPDNSWDQMVKISAQYPEVISLRLSRNFGQHPAIIAGLTQAKGEWIVIIDCDLQDQPNEIIRLYNKALEGYDIVFTQRANRKDGFFKKLFSRLFTLTFKYLADISVNNTLTNFGIYNRKTITAVLNIGDYIKSFPLFVYFTGFKSTMIFVEHRNRASGKSSYTYAKLISLAFNIIIAYSNKPLKIFVKFGMLTAAFSFIWGLIYLIQYFNGTIKVSGYASIIISIWFLSGVTITVIGIVGIYVGKVFEQTKNRPAYIIDKIFSVKK